MPNRSLDAVFYIKEPPAVCFEDGLFKVTFQVGVEARFELVMSPNNFLKMRRIAGRAVARFHAGEDNIVALGKPTDGTVAAKH